jgi:hypothetical protein
VHGLTVRSSCAWESRQYGPLLLDGKAISGLSSIEATSLLWSSDGRRLAARELESWDDKPATRVVVLDVEQRVTIAASASRRGLAIPVSIERGALIYRRWNQRTGEQELRLKIGQTQRGPRCQTPTTFPAGSRKVDTHKSPSGYGCATTSPP